MPNELERTWPPGSRGVQPLNTRVCTEGLHRRSARGLHGGPLPRVCSHDLSPRPLCKVLRSTPAQNLCAAVRNDSGLAEFNELADDEVVGVSERDVVRDRTRQPTPVRALPFVRSRGDDLHALIQQRPAQTPAGRHCRTRSQRSGPARRPCVVRPPQGRHRRSSDGGARLTAADTAPQRTTRPDKPRSPPHPRLHNVDATPHDHDQRPVPEFATHTARTRVTDSSIAALSRSKVPQRNMRHELAFGNADRVARDSTTDLASLICTARSNDLPEPDTISPQPSRFDRETLLEEAHRLADAAKQHQQRTRRVAFATSPTRRSCERQRTYTDAPSLNTTALSPPSV